jgi:hypothetical protein
VSAAITKLSRVDGGNTGPLHDISNINTFHSYVGNIPKIEGAAPP